MITVDTRAAVKRLMDAHAELVRHANQAFEDFAKRVVQAAREIAPVATGFLRDHIAYEMMKDGVLIKSGAHYSIFVEFGTVKMAAQPYFYRSVEENLPSLIADLQRAPL